MQKPVIVRSSSPYEYGDFEGIFESVRDVKDKSQAEKYDKFYMDGSLGRETS